MSNKKNETAKPVPKTKKAIETATATKKAPVKKAAKKIETVEKTEKPKAVKKDLPVQTVPAKEQAPYQFKRDIAEPKEGATIFVTTADNLVLKGTITGVHAGLRVDATLVPLTGNPYGLGTIQHASKADKAPFWAYEG